MRQRKLAILSLVAILSVSIFVPAFAGEWKPASRGWWYQNDDGSYPASTWQWIDGNSDGISESYYFDDDGYLATNTTIDGYTVDENGCWTVNGQVQTKHMENGIKFIDFAPYFNMDLHTLAAHFGYSEEDIESKINWSRIQLDKYTFAYSGGITFENKDTDARFVFAKDMNSTNGISNELTAVYPGDKELNGLMTGLTKEEYTASELEDIVKQAGATNIKKTEKVEKESVWGVSSNGALVPTNNYKNDYTTILEFDYNGLHYILRNPSRATSTPLISIGWIERIK